MQKWTMKYGGAMFFAGVLALTGCSGSKGADGANGIDGKNGINGIAGKDGKDGVNGLDGKDGVDGVNGVNGLDGKDGADGVNGVNGVNGTNGMSGATGGKLKLVIDSVTTDLAATPPTSVVTFTIYPAAAVCPGGTCVSNLSNLGQKTFYATEFDPGTGTFTTARNFQYAVMKFKGVSADGNGAQYTATNNNDPAKNGVATFAPEASANAFVYGYIADKAVLPAPASGHYMLPDNVSSAAKVYGTVAYTSTANVSGCENCHGAPYSKHGYRQAKVAPLNDFVACKACHTDQRPGTDGAWYLLVDDPAAYAANGDGLPSDGSLDAKYAYTANLMNDTHNSHAFEFAYPQSMSNCVTCHAKNLDKILTDANFRIEVCRSCHPVTGVGGIETGRAPALAAILPAGISAHSQYLYADQPLSKPCGNCHDATTFKTIHAGYNKLIYKDVAGTLTRYSDAFEAVISTPTLTGDVLAFTVTVNEKIAGTGLTVDKIVPTAYVAPYAYGTKDFLGSKNQKLTAAAGTGFTVTAGTATATSASWDVTFDLTTGGWAQYAAGGINRVEIAVLPSLPNADGITSLDHSGNTVTSPVALNAPSKTFDLVKKAVVTSAAIVDAKKCNACHDALGTTFHDAARGGNVVVCRICHVVTKGAGSYEMQSRSIDSFVHAAHSMQVMAIGSVKFGNAVEKLWAEEHVKANYPNFAGTQNCESCHVKGTYDVPDQSKSMPSLLSTSAALYEDGDAKTIPYARAINGIPSYIVGPASRACGSCHRAEAINEDDVGFLAAFNSHTAMFGTMIDVASGTTLDAYTQYVMATLGVKGATKPASTTGMQIESCEICHPTAGADHQARFNAFKDGL